MPTCLNCQATYHDQLRRCPHCGEAPEGLPPGASAQDVQGPDLGSAGDGALTGAGRKALLAILLGISLVAGGILIVRTDRVVRKSARSSTPDDRAKPQSETLSAHPRARVGFPSELTAQDPSEGFGIDLVERTPWETLLVRGTCPPMGTGEVSVDGHPARISPDGSRFSIELPGDSAQVEAICKGISGKEAHTEHALPPARAPVSVEPRVRNFVDGESVAGAQAKLKLEDTDGRLSVDLVAIQNVVHFTGGGSMVLYRAPDGFTYLRTTPKGQATFLRHRDGSEMVLVPAGLAEEGDDAVADASPRHLVQLSAFLIDRTEVSCRQYAIFLHAMRRGNDRSYRHPEDHGVDLRPSGWPTDEPPAVLLDYPVTGVCWYAAYTYARWVGGRLPTEAEWEKAAAGPFGRAYPWGKKLDRDRCRFQEVGPVPVDSMPEGEGPYSLLHMSGNVREWCRDSYDPSSYKRGSRTDPLGPPENARGRVVRGGSYLSSAGSLKLQRRDHLPPRAFCPDVGFRVVVPWLEYRPAHPDRPR